MLRTSCALKAGEKLNRWRCLASIAAVFCLTVIALTFGPGAASAADLKKSTVNGCDWTFSGTIKSGDAKKFSRLPPAGTIPLIVCLDSGGGNLVEAQKIFDVFWRSNVFTVVRPGAKCLSACAVAFLGGNWQVGTDVIRYYRRNMWPSARVGFHGPALTLPAGQTYQSEAVQSAFNIALDVARKFYDMNQLVDGSVQAMSDHLYYQILATKSSDMYMIDEVLDAVVSDIRLQGIIYDTSQITKESIRNICDNTYIRHYFPKFDNRNPNANPILNIDMKNWMWDTAFVHMKNSGDTITGAYGPYYSGTKYHALECLVSFSPSRMAREDFDGIDVSFVQHSTAEHVGDFDYGQWRQADPTQSEHSAESWYIFPFTTKLASLPFNPTVRPTDWQQHTGDTNRTDQTAAKPSVPTIQTGNQAGNQAGTQSAIQAGGFKPYQGYDLAGGDISSAKGVSAKQCLASCRQFDGCTAFTYDRWNKFCSLKDVTTSSGTLLLQAKSDTYVIAPLTAVVSKSRSAVVYKRRRGKAFFDAPYHGVSTSTFADCETHCSRTENCMAFNFVEAAGSCLLFDRPSEYFTKEGSRIGFKLQSQ